MPPTPTAPQAATPLTLERSAPLVIVMNAGSGHDEAARVRAEIERRLAEAGREYRLALVTNPKLIMQVAREAVAEAEKCNGVVVVAGGDGTINAVVNAHYGSKQAFAVLPQGTFNFVSRTHGIPAETDAALDVLLNCRAHPVQVGLVNDHVFLVNASLGLYPEILEDREGFKRRLGRRRWVALVSGLVTVLHHHRQLELEIETEGATRAVTTPTLFVGNNRLQLERVGIAEAPALDHGRLVGLTLRPVGLLEMLWLALRGALGTLGDAEDVHSFAFARITVRQRRGLPGLRRGRRFKVAADGEIEWMKPPIRFEVGAEPLYLVKPEPRTDGVERVA